MASETVFRTVNEALEYLCSLKESGLDNSDEGYDLCQLPPEENERVTDIEKIDDNNLGEVEPTCVCVQFFGLLLLSGFHSVPTEDFYWSAAEDVEVRIVLTVMSRNRFREMKTKFNVMNNSKINLDYRLAKIRPLYDELNKQFIKFGFFHNTLGTDESMVPYYGHHLYKTFIRGKPIRCDYKIWILCFSNSCLYKIEIYLGKIYFDNIFTSYDLLSELSNNTITGTGAVRGNSMAKCPLLPANEMSKTKRGTYDYLSEGNVYVCRWNAIQIQNHHVGVVFFLHLIHVISKVRVASIPVPLYHFLHQLLGRTLEVVRPAYFGEQVQVEGGYVEGVVSQLSRLVVPGEDMVVVVPALSQSQSSDIYCSHDTVEWEKRGGIVPSNIALVGLLNSEESSANQSFCVLSQIVKDFRRSSCTDTTLLRPSEVAQ
ncbi:hypothetical protein PR048_006825, partial [Dryococelus australis]